MGDSVGRQHWFAEHLLADAELVAAVVDRTDPATPVPTCPGWDLATLTQHLGRVHRWARFCVLHPDRRPTEDEAAAMEDVDDARPGDWLREGAEELAPVLRAVDPGAETWHPFPVVEQLAGTWPRRMAHETALHRWDAQHAAGAPGEIDPELAADGVAEYFGLVVPRRVVRDSMTPPSGSIAVRCDDVDDAWVVHAEADAIVVSHGPGDADAELRGAAADLLLLLWGRTDVDEGTVAVDGEPSVAHAWLAVAGM